ncbi:unnamed protein product [Echinostoma caproni]|uniref:PI3K/PI4K domain-containing protein n=1 Tax=Echinostoma caproni TaxID=27848 RepID=A0A183ASR6_9TREM|nr:unnamed protein product [Echinostoma caproni]
MHGEPASQARDVTSFICEPGGGSLQIHGARGPGATLGGPAIWEACLHQVLVRLSLPDPAIRNCLVALLTRLILTGRETESTQITNRTTHWRSSSLRFAAHLVFPSVVAAMDSMDRPIKVISPLTKKTAGANLEPCHQDAYNRGSGSGFVQIVSALQAAGFGSLVRQVETFVLELQRLTLLWEELWLGCLLQHLDELAKKVTLLETETKRSMQWSNFDHHSSTENTLADKENRVSESPMSEIKRIPSDKQTVANSNSIQDVLCVKFVAVAQPTLDLISRLSSLTLDVQPETPHEEWFQKAFGSTIRHLSETLSHPTELMDGKHLLNSVRQLVYQLQTVHQSASNAPVNRIFPRLTQMHFGDQSDSTEPSFPGIPLPGRPELESAHLINRVTILPTKTKPKRLLFRARNGHTYPYLLKGLEDLRLDDRIMRLFELINVALAQQRDVDLIQLNQMCARTYAITPLGVRAGLLQMVHGAVPLFSLYKRWQIRSSKPLDATDDPDSSRAVAVPRPGELFHARLKESLLAAGLPYQPQARNSWPIETLRHVFLSLESETPSDLLARELWAANPSAASWWSTSRTFCRSIGLMSVLGYIVGLGDRHLDNLLTDLTTGHLIHIDYNVCFDKGRNLRVAERVPFRLTRILRHTLGPLAQGRLVRGTFRVAAEQTLTVARSVIDPFLIQLKAFLIDPLVDWQDRKQSNSTSSVMVTDFTHLSAYYGGGSSATRYHFWASCMRKQSRVSAEARTCAGLLATRLYDLYHSTSLVDVCSALSAARSCFQFWVSWCQTARDLSEAEQCQQILIGCAPSNLDAAETRCKNSEEGSARVMQLRTSLRERLVIWNNEALPLCRIFSRLSDPTWLPSLMAMQASTNLELNSVLTQYFLLARIYLTHPGLFADDNLGWTQELHALHNVLEQFVDGSEQLETCLNRFTQLNYHKISRNPNGQLVELLEHAIHRSRCVLSELQDSLQVSNAPEGGTLSGAIRPESDNLHLFVYDQGVFGVSAYVWALIDYLPGVIGNILSLESDFDAEAGERFNEDLTQGVSETNPLNQLSLSAEYLTVLFSVFYHQPTGTLQFSAGFEADAQREMAFMYAVRDATLCISQLRTNLIRLLILPETESALIDAASPSSNDDESNDLVEQFTELMARYVTESDPVGLRDRVNHFLRECRTTITSRDVRLHQVLLAVHLALTNTTTQMEEIAMRIRELTVTAPAWFYVDVISQSVSNLLSRCHSWRNGATTLWGWEQTGGADIEPSFRCSWVDEVYAMGLMAFVSILEEGRAHWNAIRGTSAAPTQDLVLNPCSEAIDRFVSRLVSRTGLASLLAFSFGRLFCSLVEDTGIQIRRLVMESEHNAKVAGVHNAVLQLSAEKLAETVGLHLAAVQPVTVHHLRGPASNLIHRLAIHANQANDYLFSAIKLELARKHHDRLQQSLAVLRWISPTSDKPQMFNDFEQLVNEESNVSESIKSCQLLTPNVDSVLCNLKQTIASIEDNASGIADVDNPTLCDVARAICFAEEMRISGIESYSGYTQSLRLLTDLKQALQEEEAYARKYSLKWPAAGWLDQRCPSCADGTAKNNRTLRAQLQADVRSAKSQFNQAQMQIMRIRSELLAPLGLKGDSDSHPTNPNEQTSIVMNRHGNKRPNCKHSRSNLSTSPGLVLSSSPNDSSMAAPTRASPLTSKLRSALTTLQSQRLSELRQLVKLLNRCESARTQLAVDGDSGNVHIWAGWLDKHQSWTNLVLSTLRQLSKFLTKLSANCRLDSQSVGTNQESYCVDESNAFNNLSDEAEIAERLLLDCSSIHANLWSALLEPLFEALQRVVEPDESLSHLVLQLLAPIKSQIQSLFTVDSEQNLLASSVELVNQTIVRTVDQISSNREDFCDTTQDAINAQAFEVWCRTRDRLIGHDPLLEPFQTSANTSNTVDKNNTSNDDRDMDGRNMSVHQQVDACIRAATDIDNLALMYEGWTAWV